MGAPSCFHAFPFSHLNDALISSHVCAVDCRAYLVDNGDIFFIRVGRALSPEFVSSVFEQDPTNVNVPTSSSFFVVSILINSHLSLSFQQQLKLRERVADDVGSLLARVHNILDYLRAFSTCYQRIKVRQPLIGFIGFSFSAPILM